MRVDVLTPDELEPGLVARWRMLQRSAIELRSPFYTPDFTQAVAAHRADARIAVIEADGEVQAVLPFHAKRFGVASPIGGQISDYQGLIAAPGFAIGGAELLRRAGIAVYDYNHGLWAQAPFRAGAYARSVSPVIDLADGFEVWREERLRNSKKALQPLERKGRKIAREVGPLTFRAESDDPSAWEATIRWKNAAVEAQGSRSALRRPWVMAVLEDIRATRRPEFAGVLSTLHAGDRLVATHFGMRSDAMLNWWFPTYDPEMGKYSPGLLILTECVRWAAGEGLQRLDFGRGTQDYKRMFANGEVPLCEGSLERAYHPAGALRRMRKGVHAAAVSALPDRYADLQRRAFNRVLGAALL